MDSDGAARVDNAAKLEVARKEAWRRVYRAREQDDHGRRGRSRSPVPKPEADATAAVPAKPTEAANTGGSTASGVNGPPSPPTGIVGDKNGGEGKDGGLAWTKIGGANATVPESAKLPAPPPSADAGQRKEQEEREKLNKERKAALGQKFLKQAEEKLKQ